MGLAASQARLLTITARKSDCEYESMRLSHQKLSLSRDMDAVSEEYENAISQTELIWDFYGNSSQYNDLTYGLLMSPSALNDFTPTLITDSSGRVVLSSDLANAARAAGIPQEGMDGLPSSDVRNKFIIALADNDVITENTANNIKLTTYNQTAGVGSTDLTNVCETELTLTELINYYFSNITIDLTDLLEDTGGSNLYLYITDADGNELATISGNDGDEDDTTTATFTDSYGNDVYIDAANLTLDQLFADGYTISLCGTTWDNSELGSKNGLYSWSVIDKVASSSLWDAIFDSVSGILSTGDEYTDAALSYAETKIADMLECLCYVDSDGEEEEDYSNASYYNSHKRKSESKIKGWVQNETQDYVGYVYEKNKKDSYNSGYGLNLSTITEAYLTYFAIYMDGITNSTYNVDDLVENCNFVDDFFTFTVVTEADTTGNNLQIAGFYDTLFNQICLNGWVENDNITDQDYMQQMLKDGTLSLSSLSDDGYYYQDNYSTNTYIKEVTDETAIAQAEVTYNREKEKINYKEEVIDLKMNNLDTEISALTTEYDTVKSVISKNIEKGFTRYDA